jgi:ABC-2 type transport system permease protein
VNKIAPLIAKEMRLYFISPIVYVVAAVFLLVSDYLFYGQIVFYSAISTQMMQFQQNLPQINLHTAVFRPTFMNMSIILLFIVPLLTMRLFAEEKRGRTFELLFTSPITITEMILAKFLSAFLVYLLLLTLTLHVPLILSVFTVVPIQPLLTAYLGLALMGGVFVAFGLFASTTTENQIISAVVSFGILIGLWLIGGGQGGGSTPFDEAIRFLSMVQHLDNLVKGLLDTRDISYFVSMIVLGLFLSHRMVESTRWK